MPRSPWVRNRASRFWQCWHHPKLSPRPMEIHLNNPPLSFPATELQLRRAVLFPWPIVEKHEVIVALGALTMQGYQSNGMTPEIQYMPKGRRHENVRYVVYTSCSWFRRQKIGCSVTGLLSSQYSIKNKRFHFAYF